MTQNYHVDSIRNKSLYMKLGLLKRMCSDFNDSSALKILLLLLIILYKHFRKMFKIKKMPHLLCHMFLLKFLRKMKI